MSRYIHKSHNVTTLMYHLVCPAKYRKVICDPQVDAELKLICLEIELRYEIEFLEIGTDKNHVHFFVQASPSYSPTQIARTIKSITAREIFKRIPEVKKLLWGGEFWSKGYFMSTVGKHGNEKMIARYVKAQGHEESYKPLYQRAVKAGQLSFWQIT